MKNIYPLETSVLFRIIYILVVFAFGVFIAYVVFLSVLFIQGGFDVSLLNERIEHFYTDVYMIRLMQVCQSIFVFICPPFILSRLYKESSKSFLHLRKPKLNHVFIAIFSILIMIPLINVLVQWNEGMHLPSFLKETELWMRESENTANRVTELMLNGTGWYDLTINLIVIAILAGIGEELLFRGFFQSIVARILGYGHNPEKNKIWVMHTTIWTVAFLFSAIHLQFYGFIPRLLLGVWFGYLLWWTGSIWIPILAHMTNNAISTMAVYSENNNLLKNDPNQIGLNETWWLCLISILLLAATIVYLKKEKRRSELSL